MGSWNVNVPASARQRDGVLWAVSTLKKPNRVRIAGRGSTDGLQNENPGEPVANNLDQMSRGVYASRQKRGTGGSPRGASTASS